MRESPTTVVSLTDSGYGAQWHQWLAPLAGATRPTTIGVSDSYVYNDISASGMMRVLRLSE